MNHILVTGATGFIGSHLVRRLVEMSKNSKESSDIVCLVRSTSDLTLLKNLDVKCVVGDLRQPDSLVRAVRGARQIYHLGAELYTISRSRFLATNTQGTRNLLEAAETHAKQSLERFLMVSSQAAAGPSRDLNPVTEESPPTHPVSWYAESKQAAEKICHSFMKQIPLTIVRPSSVYGERDPSFYHAFQAINMRLHPLSGLKKRYTGMIHVSDAIEGIIQAAQHDKTKNQTYFLTNPENYSVKTMVKKLAVGIGKPKGITLPVPFFLFQIVAVLNEIIYLFFRRKPIPSRDKVKDLKQIYWLCTPEKAKRDFGWTAQKTLEEGANLTHKAILTEHKTLLRMPLESRGILWTKYILLGTVLGALIEGLATFGRVYLFDPWWLILAVVPLLWGLTFGSLAMVTRTKSFVLQFLPGFLILFTAELANHFFLKNWTFYHFHKTETGWQVFDHSLLGITQPFIRAAVLGIATGLLIPLVYNGLMKMFYQKKCRHG